MPPSSKGPPVSIVMTASLAVSPIQGSLGALMTKMHKIFPLLTLVFCALFAMPAGAHTSGKSPPPSIP